MEIDLMTPKQAAEKWGISARRVQALCAKGQVESAVKLGLVWLIPKNTPKPPDGRSKNGRKPIKNKRENNHGKKEK